MYTSFINQNNWHIEQLEQSNQGLGKGISRKPCQGFRRGLDYDIISKTTRSISQEGLLDKKSNVLEFNVFLFKTWYLDVTHRKIILVVLIHRVLDLLPCRHFLAFRRAPFHRFH